MQTIISLFLQTYKARLKHSTWRDYKSISSCHLSNFNSLDDLNKNLEPYLAGLPISGKRRNNILSCARSFMAWAKRREIWSGQPHRIPRFPHRPRKIKPLTPEEAQLIMNFSPQPYRSFYQISILTGLRTGEALGLRFEDFNLKNRVINIRRSLTGGKLATPKTIHSEREIPLLRPIWEIYERRRRENSKGSPWFFYSPNRGILSLSAIRRTWKAMLKAFEIEDRPLYATRHTFASLALAAGEDPLWIAQIMGHARPDQLLLRYASYLKGVKADGEKLTSLLIGKASFMRVVE